MKEYNPKPVRPTWGKELQGFQVVLKLIRPVHKDMRFNFQFMTSDQFPHHLLQVWHTYKGSISVWTSIPDPEENLEFVTNKPASGYYSHRLDGPTPLILFNVVCTQFGTLYF